LISIDQKGKVVSYRAGFYRVEYDIDGDDFDSGDCYGCAKNGCNLVTKSVNDI
jgi:hypothetical protein